MERPVTRHYDDRVAQALGDWNEERDENSMFADPGGRSALRASSRRNPRNRSCPDCGAKNVLTAADVAAGYCCNACADRNERGGD